jgi:hypothetical protein
MVILLQLLPLPLQETEYIKLSGLLIFQLIDVSSIATIEDSAILLYLSDLIDNLLISRESEFSVDQVHLEFSQVASIFEDLDLL